MVLFAVIAGFHAPPACHASGGRSFGKGEYQDWQEKPTRIVSLAPSVTEIVFALGEGHRLVGVTELCDYPPEAASIPKVGGFLRPDLERIVALKPDLCLAAWNGDPPDAMERLKNLGLPVRSVHPDNLDAVMDAIREIGRWLGSGQKADALAHEMRDRIGRVSSLVALAEDHPGVFFQIGVTPIVSVGSRTFINELITLAGGSNLAGGPLPYPRFSREQVLALRPELIVLTSMSRGVFVDKVAGEWREWKSLPAVERGRVFVVDSNLFDRPSPRLVEGLELLARLIHPELF